MHLFGADDLVESMPKAPKKRRRFSSTRVRSSPTLCPRLSVAKGGRLTPPCRLLKA